MKPSPAPVPMLARILPTERDRRSRRLTVGQPSFSTVIATSGSRLLTVTLTGVAPACFPSTNTRASGGAEVTLTRCTAPP